MDKQPEYLKLVEDINKLEHVPDYPTFCPECDLELDLCECPLEWEGPWE